MIILLATVDLRNAAQAVRPRDPGDPRISLASILYDPETKQADQAVVVVEQPRRTIRIQIGLEPIQVGDPSIPGRVAQTLQELGEALRHTEDAPLTASTLHRFQT